MISIEDACKIALSKIPEDKTFEKPVIGPHPLAIFKKDGDFEYCLPWEKNTGEYYVGPKKKIPFPEYLVTSGRAKTPAPSGN